MKNNWILVLLLLLMGLSFACGFGAQEEEPAATAPVAATTVAPVAATSAPAATDAASAGDATDSGPAPVDIALTTAPRGFYYSGVDFTVTEGVLTNRSPFDPNTAGEQFRAELTVTGTNESGFKALISNGALRINFADGTVVEQVLIDSVENNDTRTYLLSGAVQPATQWEGATLTISEPEKEPLTISLTGAETVTGEPIALISGGKATGLNAYGESIDFQVTDASLRLDGPQSGGYFVRVPAGKQFVMVTVRATNTGGQNGVSIYAEQFQVVADGEAVVVYYDVDGAQSVALNGSTEVSYTFLIPGNSSSIQFTVAADGTQPQQIQLK